MNQTTATRDASNGAKDAKAGFYDKWYRYNRIDEGQAYDNGFSSVEMNSNGCQIIELA